MAQARESKYVITAEDRSRQAFASLERNFKNTERMLSTLRNLTVGAFSVAGLTAFIGKMAETDRLQNRLTATINAQGHAAGFTRRQLDDMADALARATEFDDDAFTSAQAELLKVGNIYNDVFERALKASADLASFNGTDLLTATQTVARALQSPAQSLKQFEAQLGKIDPVQKKVIENFLAQNKGVEAQNKLLEILQAKVGGTAALMNTGYVGATKNVTEKWDDLLKSLGRSEAVATGVVTAINAITSALGFLDDVVKGPADSEIQARLVQRLQRDLGILKEQRGSRFGAYPEDILPGFLNPSETERRIKAAEDALKNAQRDLDTMRQLELNLLFGDKQTAKKPPPVLLNPGGVGGGKKKPPGLESFWLGDTPMQPNRNLLGIDAGLFNDAFRAAAGMTGEERANALGLTSEFFDALEREQEYNALGLRQKREREVLDAAIGQQASDFLRGIREETDLMGANARQRQHILDMRYLEFIGLKEGMPLWDQYREKITQARNAQERLNGSWEFGATRALQRYAEDATRVADSVDRLFTRAFGNMEDALVEFVKTGKLTFHSLAESIVDDLIRIQIQQSITTPLSKLIGAGLSSLFPGTTTAGPVDINAIFPAPRAAGGPVSAMSPYWVGEQGPELFVPRTSGSIVANDRAGGPTVYIDARGADQAAIKRLESALMAVNASIEQRSLAAVSNQFYRGGRISKIAGA
jgi:hypothetical protein